jgi:hypothetical protein
MAPDENQNSLLIEKRYRTHVMNVMDKFEILTLKYFNYFYIDISSRRKWYANKLILNTRFHLRILCIQLFVSYLHSW